MCRQWKKAKGTKNEDKEISYNSNKTNVGEKEMERGEKERREENWMADRKKKMNMI